MDLLLEYQFSVEHQHNDGSWSPLVEDPARHDAAGHDPERGWVRRIFRCPSCSETVALKSPEPPPAPAHE
ncbi:MAG TPA: hypothetical protein VFO05_01640 [Candidatus Limnocylindrales bacterium]|nr:hypothetical protein [Candidatus Limnocylindrales bacterium]